MENVGPPLPGHGECGGFMYVGPKLKATRQGVTHFVRHGQFGTYYCKSCGMVYSGAWSRDKRHGTGFGAVEFGGYMYKGEWADNRAHGRGRLLLNREGSMYREGTFVDGQLHGEGTEYGPYNFIYRGTFDMGTKRGQGTLETPRSTWVGAFDNDHPLGEGVLTITDVGTYTGTITEVRSSCRFTHEDIYGEGKFVSSEEEHWIKGKFIAGTLRGPGETFFEGKHRIGEFNTDGHGDLNGEGEMRYADGTVHKGTFLEGEPHGRGRMVTPKGSILEGNWVEGECRGQVKFTMDDGDTYVGEWFGHHARGRGTYTFTDGETYTGLFSNDPVDFTMNGPNCVITYPDGSSYRGAIVNDKREGRGVAQGPTDNPWRYEGEFKNNNRHGRGTWTFARDGSLRKGTWEAGELHGFGVAVLANDQGVYRGHFKMGVRHGDFTASILGRSYCIRFQDGERVGCEDIAYVPTAQLLDLGWDEVKEVPPPPPPPPPSVGLPQCACCLEREVECAMVPCGHMCVCRECAPHFGSDRESRDCPMCRARIEQVLRLYKV
jgi:hypothetical protein